MIEKNYREEITIRRFPNAYIPLDNNDRPGDSVKKGQGALEYLMTYGWALLVIVVVGAALFALGVLNPSTYTQKSCRGFAFFSYQDQQLTTGDYTVQVLNGAQDTTITGLLVTGDSTALGNLGTVNVTNDQGVQIASASRGQKITISGTNDPTSKASGDSYTYTITIQYSVTGGIAAQTDSATCSGKVQ